MRDQPPSGERSSTRLIPLSELRSVLDLRVLLADDLGRRFLEQRRGGNLRGLGFLLGLAHGLGADVLAASLPFLAG